MIRTQSLELAPGAEHVQVLDSGEVRLLIISNDRQLPFDVTIKAFNRAATYPAFAACGVGTKLGSFIAAVDIAFRREAPAFFAVVGLYSVQFIDFSAYSIREILKLFREERDDRGFYRMQLHPLADGFLVNYESGVARVNATGEVAWHRKMVWNDVFVREENGALLFANELNPKGFHISVADGSKLPV